MPTDETTDDQRTTNGRPTTNLEREKGRKGEGENPKNYSDKASGSKLSKHGRMVAKRFETSLNTQWVNDAGKWVNRIKSNLSKCERVVAEVENAAKEHRIDTTPAQYAEDTWKRFK